MPLYVIERHFAEQLEVTREGAAQVWLINDEIGVHWLFSFLSAEKRKTSSASTKRAAPSDLRGGASRRPPADVMHRGHRAATGSLRLRRRRH